MDQLHDLRELRWAERLCTGFFFATILLVIVAVTGHSTVFTLLLTVVSTVGCTDYMIRAEKLRKKLGIRRKK